MAFPDEIQNSAPDHPAQIIAHVPQPVVISAESVPVSYRLSEGKEISLKRCLDSRRPLDMTKACHLPFFCP